MNRFQEHFRRLLRLLRRRGRTREDAEDLIQEAFLRLHTYCKASEIREREAFLARTVLNLHVDAHRREHRQSRVAEPLENLPLVDAEPSPDEVIEVQQRLDQIERTLGAVSLRTLEMYRMNRVEGYSYTEIAKKLGISVSAVEKHMTRALLALMAQGLRK